MPICKLCLKQVDALVKAHLLPASFFRRIKDGPDSLLVIPSSEVHPYDRTEDGPWDRGILCPSCDSELLGSLDRFGDKIHNKLNFSIDYHLIKDFRNETTEYYWMKGVDAQRLKLFWLSVIWRFSVSQTILASGVKLEPEDEENIRALILSGDAGETKDYSIFIEQYSTPPVVFTPTKGAIPGWFYVYTAPWMITIRSTKFKSDAFDFVLPALLEKGRDPLVMGRDEADSYRLFQTMAGMATLDEALARENHSKFRKGPA